MDTPEISVYGEAKGEYTRQLCVFLVPCLESYVLELLEQAKGEAPNPQKVLWHFQTLLQSIPDWNQDKVVRETEKIQKDCNCDYLEELLTAVFIAHTKVLSAIRLSTKQKKLQITIPKVDHFLHRLLSESARALWTNAYLFAETNSIEKQKNLRQVSALLQEAVLQAIRGLLPVKSILREYLHDDEDEELGAEGGSASESATATAETPAAATADAAAAAPEAPAPAAATSDAPAPVAATADAPAAVAATADAAAPAATADAAAAVAATADAPAPAPAATADAPAPAPTAATADAPAAVAAEPPAATQPTINIDTKPSVSFSQGHVFFDSNTLEENEIHDIPFAEAENREDDEEDNEEDVIDDYESLTITDDVLPMEADEVV